MTRLIDADALKERKFPNGESEYATGWNDAVDAIMENTPSVDAIPIEFIEKRIANLKKVNEYMFIQNGGFTSPSDYEQWELERLIRDWKKQR